MVVAVVCGDELLLDISAEARGLCKTDVEGFELEVVTGMKNFIATHACLEYCVEATAGWIQRCSPDKSGVAEPLSLFSRHGFAVGLLRSDGAAHELRNLPIEQVDLIFSRADRL